MMLIIFILNTSQPTCLLKRHMYLFSYRNCSHILLDVNICIHLWPVTLYNCLSTRCFPQSGTSDYAQGSKGSTENTFTIPPKSSQHPHNSFIQSRMFIAMVNLFHPAQQKQANETTPIIAIVITNINVRIISVYNAQHDLSLI